MSDAMVTGRMKAQKKQRGGAILRDAGLSPSQAINLMYDRIISEGSADFLALGDATPERDGRWANAARFVDSLSEKRPSRFDNMSKDDIRRERLTSRGLM